MLNAKCQLEIDLNKIRANYKNLQLIAPKAFVGAAVKANCYGLGIKEITPVLYQAGCRHYFVCSIEEALALKQTLPGEAFIYILYGVYSNEEAEIIYNQFIPVLNYREQVQTWQNYLVKTGKRSPCAIHFNTGMQRLGMLEDELVSFIDQQHILDINLIMSHLSESEQDNENNQKQLVKFNQYIKHFPGSMASIANSGGVFLGKDYHLDLVRPGAAIYGLKQPQDFNNIIQNPVKLIAPIIQIQKILKNSAVGYNGTYKAKTDQIIATLPLGYADGYSRALSNLGKVYIDNIAVSVVGRVSMDLITIDVTHLPAEKIFLGSKVEVIGNNCTVDQIAAITGTIGYEVLTSLGHRFQRTYIDYD